MSDTTDLRVLRISDLEKLGFGSRTTQHRKLRHGKLPAPDFNDGRPGWFADSFKARLQQGSAG